MNPPAKYVVSKSLQEPIWRNTTIIRDNVVEAVRKLKAALLYPIILGGGKRLLPERVHATFRLKAATPYPSGVVGLHYERERLL